MKKKIALFLAIVMIFAATFIACGGDNSGDSETTPAAVDVTTPAEDDATEPEETEPEETEPEETEPEEEEDPFEYNPRLELAWRKDDTTVVFQLDTFVSLGEADLLDNVYIASTETGEAIATPTSFVTYNGELSKVWEVIFDAAVPAANEFFLCFKDVEGDGDAALETVFVDYAAAGVYAEFQKEDGSYVAAIKVTDEEITATKSLYIQWVKVVGTNTVAVKYSEPVTVDPTTINDYGHVGHVAPLVNGQLVAPATDEQLEQFPGAQRDIVQKHTRYFMAYEADPSIVLFIFSTSYYDDGTDQYFDDSADVNVEAWWNGQLYLEDTYGDEWSLIIREYPYECIQSTETGKQCTSTRDVVIEDIDLTLLDLSNVVGANDFAQDEK